MASALVFPGQGSQRPGMAEPWRGHPGFSYWEQASQLLGRDVTRLATTADAEELRRPANCQVALFVHHLVLLEAWRASGGAQPVAVAGHSLGEYDALVAAGALAFDDALRLVDARAQATEAAASDRPGSMLACLGFALDDVTGVCDDVGAHVANDNAPGQIVVSGSQDALAALRDRLGRMEGATGKIRGLQVGAAYHSPHMRAAVEPLGVALDAASFADTTVPVVANVDARPHTTGAEWPALLRDQVVRPVRWRETVTTLAALRVDRVVELGASPVLGALVKRTDRSLARATVSTPSELDEVAA